METQMRKEGKFRKNKEDKVMHKLECKESQSNKKKNVESVDKYTVKNTHCLATHFWRCWTQGYAQ